MNKLLILLALLGTVSVFGEVTSERSENVLGSEIRIYRDGVLLSTTKYSLDEKPFSQSIHFEGKIVITTQYDRYGRFQYRMNHGYDGINSFVNSENNRDRLTVSDSTNRKIEVFYVLENGLLEPVEDEILKDYGFIDLNGECIKLTEEKEEVNQAVDTTPISAPR